MPDRKQQPEGRASKSWRIADSVIEAAAKEAHRRSWEGAMFQRNIKVVTYDESDWAEVADEFTRDHFRELVRAPVEAACREFERLSMLDKEPSTDEATDA